MPNCLPTCRAGLLALLLFPLPAGALQISLQPLPLREGDPAFIVLDNRDTPCRFPLQQAVSPRRRGDALEVEVYAQDFCDSRLPPQTLQLPLGALPDDIEQVRVFLCIGNVPPGLDPCSLVVEGAVLPGTSAPAAQPVPLSPVATGIGALLVLLAGAGRLVRGWRG